MIQALKNKQTKKPTHTEKEKKEKREAKASKRSGLIIKTWQDPILLSPPLLYLRLMEVTCVIIN